jgi:hypothetical protein
VSGRSSRGRPIAARRERNSEFGSPQGRSNHGNSRATAPAGAFRGPRRSKPGETQMPYQESALHPVSGVKPGTSDCHTGPGGLEQDQCGPGFVLPEQYRRFLCETLGDGVRVSGPITAEPA